MSPPGSVAPRGPLWSKDTVLVVAGLTIIALALRLPSLGDSLYGDEIATNFVVHGFGVDGPLAIVAGDQENTPPLFYLLTFLTKEIGGVEGLRLISLLAGIALVPLTYLLGVRTVGRPAAGVGAALVALSPFLIFYSTEARAYALVALLVLLTALALLQAADSGRAGWWALYALCAAASAYAHNTALFALAALVAWGFLTRPEARAPLLLATAAATLLFAPWIAELREDHNNPAARLIEVTAPLSWDSVRGSLNRWAFGHPFETADELPGTAAQWVIGAGLLIGLAGTLLRARSGDQGSWWPPPAGLTMVAVLAFAAPVGVLVVSVIDFSILVPRNLIASWPAFALLLGAVVTGGGPALRAVSVALLLGGFSAGSVMTLDDENQRPDTAAAAAYIRSAGPSAVLEFPSPSPGPQSLLEATMAPDGAAAPTDIEIVPVDTPTLEDRLRVGAPGDPNILGLGLRRSTVDQAAPEAARLAEPRPLFVVWNDLLPRSLDEVFSNLPGVRLVESRQFAGFGGPFLFVHRLEREEGRGSP